MTVGFEQLPNDASLHPDVRSWSAALTKIRQIPLRTWALLLALMVISLAGGALTMQDRVVKPAAASAMPLLQMMTEKSARHAVP
jgi:hypothetical protein